MSNSIVSCYIKGVFNFSRKVLNGKVFGPQSQLQLSIMLDLDDTFPQRIIMRCRKKLECTQRLVWMERNFILFQLVRLVRDLFQFNDLGILYTSNNQGNSLKLQTLYVWGSVNSTTWPSTHTHTHTHIYIYHSINIELPFKKKLTCLS